MQADTNKIEILLNICFMFVFLLHVCILPFGLDII